MLLSPHWSHRNPGLILMAYSFQIPMLAVCLGFQLAVIEFARNVVGLADAKSGESPEISGTNFSILFSFLNSPTVHNNDHNFNGRAITNGFNCCGKLVS